MSRPTSVKTSQNADEPEAASMHAIDNGERASRAPEDRRLRIVAVLANGLVWLAIVAVVGWLLW
jgi:hypothetical protein